MFSVKIPFSITSLNVRGLQNLVKRKAMFLFCKNWDSHFIFLQETHSSECEKIVFSHGTTRSAGVAILFNKSPGKIITTRVDLNGHWVALVLNIEEVFFILINIYGYNSMSHNQRLFSELLDVIVELRTLYPMIILFWVEILILCQRRLLIDTHLNVGLLLNLMH